MVKLKKIVIYCCRSFGKNCVVKDVRVEINCNGDDDS